MYFDHPRAVVLATILGVICALVVAERAEAQWIGLSPDKDAGLAIQPHVRSVTSAAADPVGGLTFGTDASGVIIFGADARWQALDPGGTLHVTFAQLYGHELSTDHIGARTKVQSYYYPYKQFELSELTFEQDLGRGIDVLAGRANATGEFARSTYGCLFQNVIDCPFELTQATGGFPGFPYVNWGGRVRVQLAPGVTIKGGAYAVDPTRNRNSGFDWSVRTATGYVVPVEASYAAAGRRVSLGGWYNGAPTTDPYLNVHGVSRGRFGGAPLPYAGGRSGVYAVGEQEIAKIGARRVSAFGTVSAPFDGREVFAAEAVGGVVLTAPLSGRPRDRVGLMGAWLQLTGREAGYLNALLARHGSTTFLKQNEFIVEADYAVAVATGITLTPNLQVVGNPDTISRSSATRAPADALVVGLKLVIDGAAVGLPGGAPGAPLGN